MARQEAETIIGTVYKITNIINNKVYIGETIMPMKKRFQTHLTSAFNAKSNTYNYYFHRAIRKYGKDAFIIECLETIEGNFQKWVKKKIQQLEKKYIKQYKSNDPLVGYNSDSGGLGGRIPNIEVRQKQSQIKKNDPKTKERLDYARSFNKSEKEIRQYNYYTGEFIKEYKSIKNASKELNLDDSSIVKCCKHPNKHKYLKVNNIKYTFRYKSEDYIPVYTIKMTLEDNSFVDYLIDTVQCYEKYHIDKSQIVRCCKGKNNYAGKYNNLKMLWSYV